MESYNIPILVSFDNYDECLFDAFLKDSFYAYEFDKQFTLISNKIDLNTDNISGYGFLSNRYIIARIKHLEFLINYIESHLNLSDNQSSNYAISCDSDIVFFSNFQNEINSILHSRSNYTDLYIMSEDEHRTLPNIGFIIFAINDKSIAFFKELKSIYETFHTDTIKKISSIVKNYLDDNNIVYSILDINFANNNYPSFKYKPFLVKNKLCCFHATAAFNIFQKTDILSRLHTTTRKYSKTFILPHNYYDWLSLLSEANNNDKVIPYEDLKKKENLIEPIEQSSIKIYIQYIINYYDNLSEYTFFLSDSLFDTTNIAKYLVPNNTLSELCDLCNLHGGIMSLSTNVSYKSTDIQLNNRPYYISLAYFLDRIFELSPEDMKNIEYGDSDCFIIRKNNILNRPKIFYENLSNFISMHQDNSTIIEKLMLNIFDLKISLKRDNGNLVL